MRAIDHVALNTCLYCIPSQCALCFAISDKVPGPFGRGTRCRTALLRLLPFDSDWMLIAAHPQEGEGDSWGSGLGC